MELPAILTQNMRNKQNLKCILKIFCSHDMFIRYMGYFEKDLNIRAAKLQDRSKHLIE